MFYVISIPLPGEHFTHTRYSRLYFLQLLFVVYIMKLKSPTKEFVQSKNTTRGGGNTVDDVKLDDDPWRGLAATCWLVRDRWHAVKTVSTMARCWFSRLGAIFSNLFFLQDVILRNTIYFCCFNHLILVWCSFSDF